MDNHRIRYVMERDGVVLRTYDIELDRKTLAFVAPLRKDPPDWALLENNKCAGCPLNSDEHPYCPVAQNISLIVEDFQDEISYTVTTVTVETESRRYSKEVPLQSGLFSLLGLVMATSNCPHMKFLRPMARFHLPFASTIETVIRTTSMFLLRQYLRSKRGAPAEFDLAELDQNYRQIDTVNRGIATRLRSISAGDADVNALVVLHSLGKRLSASVSASLSDIESLVDLETISDIAPSE